MERASTTFRTEGRRESLSNYASDCPFQDPPFDPRYYGHARIDPIHPGGSPLDPSLWFLSRVPFRTHVRTGSLAKGIPVDTRGTCRREWTWTQPPTSHRRLFLRRSGMPNDEEVGLGRQEPSAFALGAGNTRPSRSPGHSEASKRRFPTVERGNPSLHSFVRAPKRWHTSRMGAPGLLTRVPLLFV